MVAQVEPPLLEKEMTGIYVDTLKDPFFDRLVSSAALDFASDFAYLVATPNALKKYFGGFQKNEKVTQVLYIGVTRGSNRLHMAKSTL